MITLGQLVEIKAGYTFREIAGLESGEVAVVQAGDVNAARLSHLQRIKFDSPKHLLQTGDILLSARGKTVARAVTPDLLPAVAASSVFVLRLRIAGSNPKYISQYLNSSVGQAALRQISSGAYIKTLRKSELATIEVPLPSQQTQDALVKLGEIIDEYETLAQLKVNLIQQVYDNAITTSNTMEPQR